MVSARESLIPYMKEYEEKFTDSGLVNWLPYLMYFHPSSHQSCVVNTDKLGFRYSVKKQKKFSAVKYDDTQRYKLLAGSSTVFGIGASHDQWTLASCMSELEKDNIHWINFGGRSFNSAQELLLFTLNHQHLPKIEEIVLFSGFNNLGLARQPEKIRGTSGAFFNCNTFFDALCVKEKKGWLRSFNKVEEPIQILPNIEQQIEYASTLTINHLKVWDAMAKSLGAKLTYILQPLSGWIRNNGSKEEELIFSELDKLGGFSEQYGDILKPEVCEKYAAALNKGAEELGIKFINSIPLIQKAIHADDWIFVDRIHFTDYGHQKVAKIIFDAIQ